MEPFSFLGAVSRECSLQAHPKRHRVLPSHSNIAFPAVHFHKNTRGNSTILFLLQSENFSNLLPAQRGNFTLPQWDKEKIF